MDEQAVRDRAAAYCEALLAGNIELASEELSDELQANLGQLVAMLPMPLATATVDAVERTASGFQIILHLVGENEETLLATRWKDRDGRPVIVEVSHLPQVPATTAADTDSEESAAET